MLHFVQVKLYAVARDRGESGRILALRIQGYRSEIQLFVDFPHHRVKALVVPTGPGQNRLVKVGDALKQLTVAIVAGRLERGVVEGVVVTHQHGRQDLELARAGAETLEL